MLSVPHFNSKTIVLKVKHNYTLLFINYSLLVIHYTIQGVRGCGEVPDKERDLNKSWENNQNPLGGDGHLR